MNREVRERVAQSLEELQDELDHELRRLRASLVLSENNDKKELLKDIKYIRSLFLSELQRVSEELGLYEEDEDDE